MHRRIPAFFMAAWLLFSIFPCQAKAVGTSAASAILMEADSGRVMYEQNADARMLIASTTNSLFYESRSPRDPTRSGMPSSD